MLSRFSPTSLLDNSKLDSSKLVSSRSLLGLSAFLGAYFLLTLTYGQLTVFGFQISSSSPYFLLGILVAVFAFLFLPYFLGIGLIEDCKREFSFLSFFLLPLTLLVFSSALGTRFSFFFGSERLSEILLLGFVASLIILGCKTKLRVPAPLCLILCQLALTLVFLRHANGRLIFSDDHPSFLYRLIMLREHFPEIPFYNTDWNAGYSAREFFPSGVLNAFFLLAPVIYLLPDLSNFSEASYYTYFIPYLYFWIVPWTIFLASRVFGLNQFQATVAGILSLGPSTGYFEWLLKYGTLGFTLSSGFVPLTIALSARLALFKTLPAWKNVIALIIASFFCLSWSLSVTSLLPLIVVALFSYRTLLQSGRWPKILTFIVLFLLFNGPWILIFIQQSKVLNFVSGNALPGTAVVEQHSIAWGSLLVDFRSYLRKVNPLLLLLGIPGLLYLPKKNDSSVGMVVLSTTIAWLFFVTAFGEHFKEQLELRRMIIPASFLLCLPAACLIEASWRALISVFGQLSGVSFRKGYYFLIFSVMLGSFMLSPLNVAAVLTNRSDEKFRFANREVEEFITELKAFKTDGRVFFFDFILQELGASWHAAQDGGHIAVLSSFTGHQFYASDFYHRQWSHVDPIPKSYREKGVPGVESFLDLVNASAAITFTRIWADYCLSNPNYVQVFQVGRFRLFKRKTDSNYFLKGKGGIRIFQDKLLVKADSAEIVLKFRHLPGLRAFHEQQSLEEKIELKPFRVFSEDQAGGKQRPVDFVLLKVPVELVGSGEWIRLAYR